MKRVYCLIRRELYERLSSDNSAARTIVYSRSSEHHKGQAFHHHAFKQEAKYKSLSNMLQLKM